MRTVEPGLPGGLVTFLFTDVEGSTGLHERLGDAWAPIARRHDELLGGIVRDHGGTVVKWLGDGMFAAFGDAAAAVRATEAVLTAVAAEPWPVELRVRAGLHTGPAQPHDGDYTALAVHVAARVCAAAHGGEVLATADVPGTEDWADLGEYVLRGLEAPARLRSPDPATRPRATPVVKHNVPTIRTSFVGRRAELDELDALVREHRLVSVLGPGGTGKTRLAYELARRASERYADGAWVVQLADLPAGADVDERVAAAVGLRSGTGRSLREALADWCATHEALVVLDNCEHVVPTAAALVDELLADTSRVRIVTTSREPLRVAGEVAWQLPPLPDAPHDASADAVRLFLDRARLARPDLDLSADVTAVAELCRQLDCLPLTIELAAARLRQLSLDGLLANVRDRLSLLRGRSHGVAERHQSLRALLDFSHDLLPDEERVAFRRCAAFHSTFTAAAAAAVCDLPALDAADVLEQLADRSLLQVSADVEPRYRMLGTIRDYAVDRLADAGEAAATAGRHAEWVTAALVSVARNGEAFETGDARAMLALFGGLHDDAVAALGHYADTDDAELADLANAMFWYWIAIGAYATATPWLRLAGERGDARALGRAATFLAMAERTSPEARRLAERAVELATATGDERLLAECLVRLGNRLIVASEGREGEDLCLAALRLDAAPRDRGGALLLLGIAASYREDRDTAYARFEQAIAAQGGPSQVAILQGNIADILLDRGDVARATELLVAALPVLEDRQQPAVPWVCRLLCRAALADGDPVLAGQWLDRGLRVLAATGAADSAETQQLRDLKAALPAASGRPVRQST
ncbi:MAG TPA: AAA family ATPase [Frankiaceae bacterium]|nr:AAA family ATPase [Frankiaceae bacterium]